MKKITVGLLTIVSQLLIAGLFFLTVVDKTVVVEKYETVVRNENLDKIATSVSLLFKEEDRSNIVLVNDLTIQELPSVDTGNSNQDEVVTVSDEDKNEVVTQPLVSVDASKYSSKETMGFKVTEGNKNYNLDDEYQFNVVVAVVAGEFDRNLNDALAVVSVILNRCDSDKWAKWAGSSPYQQVIMKGQFEVYFEGYYLDFMPGGNKYGKDKYNVAKQAVIDGLNGIRNNDYLGFRAWYVSSYSDKYIVTGGNRYGFN